MSERSRSRATGRVTLDDVAAVAQVSPITASRALRGVRTVAPELVERVRAAAAKLGYVPDPAARALASAHSAQVVLLVPTLASSLFVDLVEALQASLEPVGLQLLIGVTHDDPEREEQLLRGYLLQRPAGLLLTPLQRTAAARRALEAAQAPCVQLIEPAPGGAPGHVVGARQHAAAQALVRHLLERGRRRIALVAAGGASPLVLPRLEGYRDALREAGLHDARREVVDARPASLALGIELFEQLHERQRATDAVFFSDDALAQGALLAALRMHLRVPHQIAIAGFGDLAGSEHMVPPLTTASLSGTRLGSAAAERLLALVRHEPIEPGFVDVGCELRLRASS